MSPPKKSPTNSDLLREIREIRAMQVTQGNQINLINKRHELIDAGVAAVTKYKKEEQQLASQQLRNSETESKRDFYVKLTAFVVALTIFVTAVTTLITRGMK